MKKDQTPFGMGAFSKLTWENRNKVVGALKLYWKGHQNLHVGMLPFVPEYRVIWALKWYAPENREVNERYSHFLHHGYYRSWG